MVGNLRFKPAHALAAQTAYREERKEQQKAFEEGRGFAVTDESVELPDTFNDRLKRAITALEERVSLEAPGWLGQSNDLEMLSNNWNLLSESMEKEDPEIFEEKSQRCFDDFIEETKDIVFSYFQDRAAEKEAEFHRRLTNKTWNYLQDAIAYRDRLAPHVRSVDVTCPEEDLHLYIPLKKWSKEEQKVMNEMIDERLRQLLALHMLAETPEEEEEEVVVEEPKEEEVVKVVVQQETEDPEAEERARLALQAAREKELSAAVEKTVKLQAENDDLQRMLEEMRQRLEASNADVKEMNRDVKKLTNKLNEEEEPIPEPEVVQGQAPAEAARPSSGGKKVKGSRRSTARPASAKKQAQEDDDEDDEEEDEDEEEEDKGDIIV